MATGPRFAVKFRRRREGKTDYKQRLAMLKSNKHRIVIRKSNLYITCQLVKPESAGDKTIVTITSRELKKLGWKHSCKNLPAAYLTGLMLGKAAKKAKVNEAILDMGLNISVKGSRLYTALKGAIDGGLAVPLNEKILPTEERLKGSHIKLEKDFEAVRKKIL